MTAVRTLLTVLVAAAIVGASLPTVANARADRTEATLDATATRLTDAAAALAATEDPVPATETGAGRTVTVVIPRVGLADAAVAYFSIGGRPNASAPSTVGYRVADRPPRRVESGVRFLTGPRPLVLPPGRHRLRLTLVAHGAAVGVRVAHHGRATFATAATTTTGTSADADERSTASRRGDPPLPPTVAWLWIQSAPSFPTNVQIRGRAQAGPCIHCRPS